jgi:hypothetical protein
MAWSSDTVLGLTSILVDLSGIHDLIKQTNLMLKLLLSMMHFLTSQEGFPYPALPWLSSPGKISLDPILGTSSPVLSMLDHRSIGILNGVKPFHLPASTTLTSNISLPVNLMRMPLPDVPGISPVTCVLNGLVNQDHYEHCACYQADDKYGKHDLPVKMNRRYVDTRMSCDQDLNEPDDVTKDIVSQCSRACKPKGQSQDQENNDHGLGTLPDESEEISDHNNLLLVGYVSCYELTANPCDSTRTREVPWPC